ncbi:hypothetical protein KIN20_007773 [Parelaphostrongylus tenuis]|uniref:Uncharacterized protein n=1 Tax=Parelaphostrongylus tenuis TaxID=148309 RepID=A0AAD5M3U2_PARTN|nr:hypothetical protein KIN20_007773 [Parelaphostrongylus tenuis]
MPNGSPGLGGLTGSLLHEIGKNGSAAGARLGHLTINGATAVVCDVTITPTDNRMMNACGAVLRGGLRRAQGPWFDPAPTVNQAIHSASSSDSYLLAALMWSSAGPSWLVEHHQPISSQQSGIIDPAAQQPSLVIDYSPPTKWPRANTPVNARSTTDPYLLGTSADSGIGLNLTFNSPPIINRMDSRGSPGLRTPTSRPGIHLSATPSPFRSFRLSTSNSPPSGDRALRLSNCENVIGFRYRDGCIEKTFQIGNMTDPYHIEAAETAKASRCLQMPSTSDDTSFDRTLPMTMGDGYEVDGVMTDDSGLFGNDVVLHATSTPLHSSPQPYLSCTTSVPSVPNPYSDIREPKVEMMPCEDVMTKSSPPTPSSFKRAMRDVQRQGILQPRKLLVCHIFTR